MEPFEQICEYANTDKPMVGGKWEVRSDGRGIQFEKFLDCVGVWPESWTGNAASLIVDTSNDHPIILLNPDINIYYARIDDVP